MLTACMHGASGLHLPRSRLITSRALHKVGAWPRTPCRTDILRGRELLSPGPGSLLPLCEGGRGRAAETGGSGQWRQGAQGSGDGGLRGLRAAETGGSGQRRWGTQGSGDGGLRGLRAAETGGSMQRGCPVPEEAS